MLEKPVQGAAERCGIGSRIDPAIGAILIVIGLVLLRDKLNVAQLLAVLEYWPVFLIGGGIAVLLDNFDSGARP